MTRPSPRQMALFSALALSLAATVWVARQNEPEAPVPPHRTNPAATTRTASSSTASKDWPAPAANIRLRWPEADPEAIRAWGDAPTSQPAAVATLAPHAVEPAPAQAPLPPFPYQFVGRMTDTRPRAVLNNPQRSLVLGVGEVVDGQWRIESIEANGLHLKHLPSGPSQFIAFSPS